LINMKI
ncbi:dTDP-glucose 4,6-dehydratase 2, partial [Haemophilus influenzae]